MDGAFAKEVDGLLRGVPKILTIFERVPYWVFYWVLNSRLYIFRSYLRPHQSDQFANLAKINFFRSTIK